MPSMRVFRILMFLSVFVASSGTGLRSMADESIRVHPESLNFKSPESSEQLLVFAKDEESRPLDVTRNVTYLPSDPGIVEVSATGRVSPLRDGQTEIIVHRGGTQVSVPITVAGLQAPAPVSFRHEIIPILSKSGCNSGGCHGKAEGQNGFKLSVFGYDPVFDHQALVMESRGRRVSRAAPAKSLLLLKATATTPHGGGRKIEPDSLWFQRIQRWISEGAVLDSETNGSAAHLVVTPSEITLPAHGKQQLRVTICDDAGFERCVTAEAEFQSNQESIVVADREGLLSASDVPGEAAILVRYSGRVAVCRVTRPRPSRGFPRPQETNFIDRLVWDKLERLGIPPSPSADDATYLRRAYLDVIGTLPTADEARSFLIDSAPDKRARLVAALLERPEYADYWAQRWADLLQVDKDTIGPQGAAAMTRWLRDRITKNSPYDRFVYDILTAEGGTWGHSPAGFFQVQDQPEKGARAVSQLFLGVRIECAQCHHHPFERWDQSDYFAFAGFFTGIERRPDPRGGTKIVSVPGQDLPHPRTGQTIPAAGLGAPSATFAPDEDRRRQLAQWTTGRENPFFARTIANRLWAHYFGRGLVEPIDDLRETNPASNEPLLHALANHLVEVEFDIRRFTSTLLASQVYQLSAETNEGNEVDEQNFSRSLWKPLPAEVLLDAVSQVTDIPEEFNGWPRGYRAIQVWDNKLPSHFLEVFGRPARQSVCACERGIEPSIAQALHLMNSQATADKVHNRRGRAARLAESEMSPREIVEELMLTALSRFPTDSELALLVSAFDATENRRQAAEDVIWTLLNMKEFVFNH